MRPVESRDPRAPREDRGGGPGPGDRGRIGLLVLLALVALAAAFGLGILSIDALSGSAVVMTDEGPSTDAPVVVPDGQTETGSTSGVASDRPADPVDGTADDAGDAGGDSGIGDGEDGEVNATRIERAIHDRIDEIRIDRDLSALDYSPALAEIAAAHSRDMVEREYFSHVSPSGETFADRYEDHGFDCRVRTDGARYATGGENLAYTYAFSRVRADGGVVSYDGNETAIARGIVDGWMNSTGHRENILRPYWEREGIGVALDHEDGRTRVVATQNFC